ncbi:hypothetical protein RRG08_040799 [Elysia crispata]|uniref:Uncharacterized protein n=1 Tax=Elysia crispata TaxID=231223 RepID=A0AAE1BDS4_9GAST|nr:hypothetical protein RRG08_040799 [Elysia crispata]
MPPKRSQVKRRLHAKTISSSDSDSQLDEPEAKDETFNSPKRQSYRLISKRSRPDFKLPTRDAIWKDIPSMKSPEKLGRITPRKNISNFTKVYNSYNFDDYDEDSQDEDSMSDSNSSSSSKDQTPSRVKNYHKRIRIASSSSDEDKSILDPDAKIQQPDHQAVLKAGSFKKDSGDPTVPEALDHCHGESDVQSHPHKNTSSQESTDSDDIEEKVTPSQKRHNRRSIFDSDDNRIKALPNATKVCQGQGHQKTIWPTKGRNRGRKERFLEEKR